MFLGSYPKLPTSFVRLIVSHEANYDAAFSAAMSAESITIIAIIVPLVQ